jgi:hypothetical protein
MKGKNRSSRYQVGPLNVFLQDLEIRIDLMKVMSNVNKKCILYS